MQLSKQDPWETWHQKPTAWSHWLYLWSFLPQQIYACLHHFLFSFLSECHGHFLGIYHNSKYVISCVGTSCDFSSWTMKPSQSNVFIISIMAAPVSLWVSPTNRLSSMKDVIACPKLCKWARAGLVSFVNILVIGPSPIAAAWKQ